jgi:ribosomal protein S3
MISEQMKDIATKIGLFILQEQKGDYNAACEEVTRLRIHKLELEGDRLTIETSRPGLLIGKRGQRIDALKAYLGLALHIVERTEDITDYIYPYDPSEYDPSEYMDE